MLRATTFGVSLELSAGGWCGQPIDIRHASASPQSQQPPDCWAMKKLTLWPVWLVEWKHREQRTQLSSHAQSLRFRVDQGQDMVIETGEVTYRHRKQHSPFLKIFPHALPGIGFFSFPAPPKPCRCCTSCRDVWRGRLALGFGTK